MNELDEIRQNIVSANKYLKDHVFELYYLPDADGNLDVPTNVKVKLTGMKHFLDIGKSKPFVTFTAYILPSNDNSDTFNSILSAHFGKETDVKTYDYEPYSHLSFVIREKLSNLLKYFSLPEAMLTKVVNEVKPKKLNESIISESKLDSVVRQIVRDIITLYKKGVSGEFGLPEDLNHQLHAYEFPQLENPLQVFLEIVDDESVEGFDVDADYFRDDDLIYVTINSNPNFDSKVLYDLVGELNEVIAHEIEHIKQHESGYNFPKREPKKPEKYYSQSHEIDAQRAGFKRRKKVEKSDYETLVRRWFENNKHKHQMSQEEAERVIQKILAQK